MLSWSRAGVLGASVAVAGGVAYLIWNYASSSGEEKPETRLGEDGESDREQREGEKEEIREEEAPVIKAQQQQTQFAEPTTAVVEPVAAAEARNTSQVTRHVHRTHLCGNVQTAAPKTLHLCLHPSGPLGFYT